MRILICSDLHVDIFKGDPQWSVNPDLFDVAFVLGDIANHAKTSLRYLTKFKEKVIHNKDMFCVAGNHDRWGSLFSSSEYFLEQAPGYINRKVINYKGFRILGCTLWYKPSIYAKKSDWSDYEEITDWENIRSEHDQDMRFLHDEIQEGDIILTHMLPGIEAVSPQYINDPCNSFYVTELGDLIKERKPKLWCMGHSHDSLNKMVHNTLMVRNPRGYPREIPSFEMWIIDTDKIGEYDCITAVDPCNE